MHFIHEQIHYLYRLYFIFIKILSLSLHFCYHNLYIACNFNVIYKIPIIFIHFNFFTKVTLFKSKKLNNCCLFIVFSWIVLFTKWKDNYIVIQDPTNYYFSFFQLFIIHQLLPVMRNPTTFFCIILR